MFKKIALAAALAVSASFATWDYFPVLEAGKGSAAAGLYYDWDGDWSQAGLRIGARYSIIQSLELSLQGWGYQFWNETDCKGCANGGDGLRDLTIGARYEVAPMITAFLDARLPIGSDEVSSDEFALYAGAQFSMAIPDAPGFSFGSEAGIDWGFEHHNYERGLEIHVAGEGKYAIPNTIVTPYLGLQIKLQLTEDTWEDHDKEYGGDDAGDNQFNIWLGCQFALMPELTLDARLIVRSGDMDGDATGLFVGAEYFF